MKVVELKLLTFIVCRRFAMRYGQNRDRMFVVSALLHASLETVSKLNVNETLPILDFSLSWLFLGTL